MPDLIKIDRKFKKQQFKRKMILPVRDELVFYATEDEVNIIEPIIIECMQSALMLPNDVPNNTEIGGGAKWLKAHYDQ